MVWRQKFWRENVLTSEFTREYADDKGSFCFFVNKMGVVRRSMARRRPLRRSFKKSFKPRSLTRSFAGPSVPRQRMTGGFPETLTTTLNYCDSFQFTTSSATAVGNIFRLNSPFDPDFTGAGHQPLYYDQFTPVYSRYAVLGAKITATFSPLTSQAIAVKGPWRVGITANNDGSFSTSGATLQEQNKSNVKIMGQKDGGNNVKVVTNTYSPLRDIGLPASDDTVGASVTTNPGTVYWCYVWVSDIAGGAGDVICTVKIQYRVKFLRQNSITGS